MTARVQLVVTYRDHQIMYYPTYPDTGWKIDAASRCVVVGKFPRTYIPMDAILSFEIESVGGDAPEAADDFASPMERLHAQVRTELANARAAENAAANAGRNGDAFTARVDALDWALQRIDEAMGQ